ncbi:HNH endonuclease [Bacillus sp. Nf3]|uniref:HNH endonuclease n=1 Tax=unclassified Bacillus (in: firmicutes) TaxID=185979 RepID=UPI0007385966|nr:MULTISPECIES: HNH endonuclease [unclassified Bacillus (in: firmicutes)]KUF22581.1 hypothetical protein AMR95_11885 [Bacillus sp. G1(2015b)]PTA85974.1 HNH endonuclease [Bacillus sp. Nf3]
MKTKIKVDYRLTSLNKLEFIYEKDKFLKEFKNEFPKAWNVYGYVNKRGEKYNINFRKLYHNRCAYCGVSTQIINSSEFEVDHFIPRSRTNYNASLRKEFINGIYNLVNSCRLCNRSKEDFFDEKYVEILNPDNNNLPSVFHRKEDYTIVISDEYKNNKTISTFYNKLKLNNQLRRLDFLLMEMKDFCEIYGDIERVSYPILNLISNIEKKRRESY